MSKCHNHLPTIASIFMSSAEKAEGVQEFRKNLSSSSCFIAGGSLIKITFSNTASLYF